MSQFLSFLTFIPIQIMCKELRCKIAVQVSEISQYKNCWASQFPKEMPFAPDTYLNVIKHKIKSPAGITGRIPHGHYGQATQTREQDWMR